MRQFYKIGHFLSHYHFFFKLHKITNILNALDTLKMIVQSFILRPLSNHFCGFHLSNNLQDNSISPYILQFKRSLVQRAPMITLFPAIFDALLAKGVLVHADHHRQTCLGVETL